jgi:hypothetical protein
VYTFILYTKKVRLAVDSIWDYRSPVHSSLGYGWDPQVISWMTKVLVFYPIGEFSLPLPYGRVLIAAFSQPLSSLFSRYCHLWPPCVLDPYAYTPLQSRLFSLCYPHSPPSSRSSSPSRYGRSQGIASTLTESPPITVLSSGCLWHPPFACLSPHIILGADKWRSDGGDMSRPIASKNYNGNVHNYIYTRFSLIHFRSLLYLIPLK